MDNFRCSIVHGGCIGTTGLDYEEFICSESVISLIVILELVGF